MREICDPIYSLYDLIRDREDSVPMACLLRPMVRKFAKGISRSGVDDGPNDRPTIVLNRIIEMSNGDSVPCRPADDADGA